MMKKSKNAIPEPKADAPQYVTKYVTKSRIRFRDGAGKQWQVEPETVISFSPGDKVDVDFLRLAGAIELYSEEGEHGEHS